MLVDGVEERHRLAHETGALDDRVADLAHRRFERAYVEEGDRLRGLLHLVDGVVHRRDQVRDVAAVEWRDEAAANGDQDLARDVVRIMLAVHHGLTMMRHGLAALQHVAQRLGPGDEQVRLLGEKRKEAFLFRHQSPQPSHHTRLSSQTWPSALIGPTLQRVMNDAPRALFREDHGQGRSGRPLCAVGRLASFVFAEPGGHEIRNRIQTRLGVLPLGRHGDRGALRRRQGEQSHDRAAPNRLPAPRDGDVRVEALDRLHEFGGRSRMQAFAINDEKVARMRAVRLRRRRTFVDARVRPFAAHLPARTREATLMYLRPASWACSTASPKPSSSRTLASLISMGRLIPATTSTEPPFMHEIARFEGVPPNISVNTTTPSPELTWRTAARMSLRRDSMSSSGPIVMVSSWA